MAELRTQLNARGLPTDGLKAELVERVWTALQQGDGLHGGEGGGAAGEDGARASRDKRHRVGDRYGKGEHGGSARQDRWRRR